LIKNLEIRKIIGKLHRFTAERGVLNPSFCLSEMSKQMDLAGKIKAWVLNYVGDGPLFLIDVQVSAGIKRSQITILVDTVAGVTIDECALLSRKLSFVMEEEVWVEGAYNLEVSSPGVDAPLQFGWQFEKNLGRKVKVWRKKLESLEGELKGYSETEVEILPEKTVKHRKIQAKETVKIPLVEVDKIKVQVSF
jgi:ribosome maturation factor RimP